MATYLILNTCFLVVLVAIVWFTARRQVCTRQTAWTLAGLVMLTAVFDNLIIIAGIVSYDPSKLLGLYIGRAPVEDFAYTIAAVVLAPLLWTKLKGSS